jgi:hypothetical protein
MYMTTITNFMDPAWPGSTEISFSVSDYVLSQNLLCNGNPVSTIDVSVNDLSQIFAPAVQVYPVGEYFQTTAGTSVPAYYNTVSSSANGFGLILPNTVATGTIVVIANNTSATATIEAQGFYWGSTSALTLASKTCSVFMSIGFVSNFSGESAPNTGSGLTTWINLVANQKMIG